MCNNELIYRARFVELRPGDYFYYNDQKFLRIEDITCNGMIIANSISMESFSDGWFDAGIEVEACKYSS